MRKIETAEQAEVWLATYRAELRFCTRERAEAWADALGRELVTTDPAVHAALTAIASGLDEMRAMAGLVQHLSRVVKMYQGRESKELREQPPRVLVLSREDKDWLWRES